MRVLITRPEPQASALEKRLADAGHTVLNMPLLTIALSSQMPDWGNPDGLVLTSAHAARALAQMPEVARTLPVYAVGEKTAAAARGAGFDRVYAAGGDARALARLIRDTVGDRRPCRLVHASGTVTRADGLDDLAEDDIEIARHIVYDAVAAPNLPDAAQQALRDGGVDWVLLFSPRSASIFRALVERAGLSATIGGVRIGCLSDAVAAELEGWADANTVIAPAPGETALLEATGLLAPGGGNSLNEADIIDVEAEEVKTPASRWRRAMRWLPWVLLLLAGLFAAGVLSAPWLAARLDGRLPWLIAAPQSASPAADPALAEKVSALEQSLRDLAARPAPSAPPVDLSALDRRIDALAAQVENAAPAGAGPGLEDRLASLEDKISAFNAVARDDRAVEQSIAMLDARLAALEQTRQTGAARDLAVMALRQLGRSVESGRPYSADLAELRGLLGEGGAADSTALSVLEAYGQKGVPTLDMLAARFDESAAGWLAAATTPANASALERMLARAKSLVSVRRTDITEGDSPEAVIARAERRLQARDLDGAVRALERLPDSGLEAAAPWLEDAGARLASLQALRQLEDQIFKPDGAGPRPMP